MAAYSVRGALILPFENKTHQDDADRRTTEEAERLINEIPLNANPYTEIVRDWLRAGGIDPRTVEEQDEDKSIAWRVDTDNGYVVVLNLYRVENEVFLWLEVGVTRVPSDLMKDVGETVLRYQYGLYMPFRFALAPDSKILTLQFRCYLNGVTGENWRIRLDSMLPVVDDLMKILSDKYGLKPLVQVEFANTNI